MSPSIVALIPARAGSKRIPGKNTKDFCGKPLIQWTLSAAINSKVFDAIIVCSDDPVIEGMMPYLGFYGNYDFHRRKPSADDEPDIAWVKDVLSGHHMPAAFAILRPTSPFRTHLTIRRAWAQFQAQQPCDSLRAVEPVKQTPYKMWKIFGDGIAAVIRPVCGSWPGDTPWHDTPTQTHPPIWIQNASLEIAWTKTVTELGTISGGVIRPFVTEGYEGYDINEPEDWQYATSLVERGLVDLATLGAQTSATAP